MRRSCFCFLGFDDGPQKLLQLTVGRQTCLGWFRRCGKVGSMWESRRGDGIFPTCLSIGYVDLALSEENERNP